MKIRGLKLTRTVFAVSSAIALHLSLLINPVWAGDPFRSSNERDLGEQTELAFDTLFKDGNYLKAKDDLIQAESQGEDDPIMFAMLASLAYTQDDWDGLKSYAEKTQKAADSLVKKDALRGNLYQAVGIFLEGAYNFEKEGPFGALAKLQEVFKYLDAAEAINADDPELNMLKGYMDLLLAVNLPFSDPNDAIERLQKYGSPDYLVNRGIAVAYRDLKKYSEALPFVESAISETPNNPELYYLKAQILYAKAKENNDDLTMLKESLANFDRAIAKQDQLPSFIVKSLTRERRLNQERIDRIVAQGK